MSPFGADLLHGVLLSWSLMAVATLSPGPANLAITATALADGRARALALTAGVAIVSLGWGLAAAAGLTALLSRFDWTLTALKIAGGLYLLRLAWRAARSAWRGNPAASPRSRTARATLGAAFRRGALLHLFNPKPVFAWLAVIAVGAGQTGSPSIGLLFAVVVLNWLTALAVFCAYAVLFSTGRAANVHRRFRRRIDALVALLFGAAGAKLLAISPS